MNYINPSMVLFLDIETAPQIPLFINLPPDGQAWFRKRFKKDIQALYEDQQPIVNTNMLKASTEDQAKALQELMVRVEQQIYEQQASLLAELCKIVCISVATISNDKLVVTSLTGDEKTLLEKFINIVDYKVGEISKYDYLCAHGGKEFDYPVLCRRMMVHRLSIPRVLDSRGKKPWEVSGLDTLELWKCGSYKHNASLAMIAYSFGIPSPKQDVDGSMVGVLFLAGEIDKIATYCEGDVIALANIFVIMLMLRATPFYDNDIIRK